MNLDEDMVGCWLSRDCGVCELECVRVRCDRVCPGLDFCIRGHRQSLRELALPFVWVSVMVQSYLFTILIVCFLNVIATGSCFLLCSVYWTCHCA